MRVLHYKKFILFVLNLCAFLLCCYWYKITGVEYVRTFNISELPVDAHSESTDSLLKCKHISLLITDEDYWAIQFDQIGDSFKEGFVPYKLKWIIELLPDRYNVGCNIRSSDRRSTSTKYTLFNARPGHVYKFYIFVMGDSWWPSTVDVTDDYYAAHRINLN